MLEILRGQLEGSVVARKKKFEKFTAATVQTHMTAGRPAENIERTILLTKRAAGKKATFILLPELFITGFDYNCIAKLPQIRTDECLRTLREIAEENRTVIVAGSVTMRKKIGRHQQLFNTTYIIGPNGRTKARYSKMHLFPLLQEDKHFKIGTSLGVTSTACGTIAPCICFDIRFPELVRRLALMGAQVLTVPAEFPHPRLKHWRTLLQARAIENQFFVIAANRVGRDHTGDFFGHSMIIGPAGEIIAEAGQDEEILLGEIDLNNIEAVRNALPCLDEINPSVRINTIGGWKHKKLK
jgi:predicted amidohydrolase